MKNIIIYLICTVALFVAIVLTCSGGWWSLAGLSLSGLLYVSGELFPKFWKSFWVSNAKILSYFGCL
jgi:hypothetical protein